MANLRKIAGGKYRIDWRDSQGRRYRKFFKTRKEADEHLTGVKNTLKTGTFISPREIPTFAEVAREWLEGKKANAYRPATLEQWRIHLDNHLLDAEHGIGLVRLDRVDVSTIERFAGERRGAGLAPQTVNKILTTAAAVFKFAIRHRKTLANPAEIAERLKVGEAELVDGDEGERTDAEVSADEVLNPEELKRLLNAAPAGFNRTLLQTVALTGMRHDEALALMWDDVDFDTSKLAVRRSLSWAKVEKTEATRAKFYPPKTKAGRRTLDLPPELMHALKVWKLQCPKGELGLVFPTAEGKPAHRSNVIRHVLKPALAAADIGRTIDMHGLRHTFASIMLAKGEPITRVANLMGHGNSGVTARVYAHWFRDRKTEAVNDLARELFADTSAQGGERR
jgi:integrase